MKRFALCVVALAMASTSAQAQVTQQQLESAATTAYAAETDAVTAIETAQSYKVTVDNEAGLTIVEKITIKMKVDEAIVNYDIAEFQGNEAREKALAGLLWLAIGEVGTATTLYNSALQGIANSNEELLAGNSEMAAAEAMFAEFVDP